MIWLAMMAVGALTFCARFSSIGLLGKRGIPDEVKRVLYYTGSAVLATIIAHEVLLVETGAGAGASTAIAIADNPRLLAFGAALIATLLTRNVIVTLVVGMCALWIIEGRLF